ncbi:hypothetical protein [Rubritalea sp.]|uniref:hypothetical protein n=1 Tax=Rubritalea sp. TaxID=2109375 RepID=UPI003EF8B994
MNDCLIIDVKAWSLVQTPGLKSPIKLLDYDDCSVQTVLAESFGVMFPNIVKLKRGVKRYEALSTTQTNVMELAKPVKEMSGIPKAELMRLIEGWIRLRRKLQDGVIDDKVTPILLNLRVPDPRHSLDRYMLYKDDDGGEDRLVICWAYETMMKPCICLEQAIAILMGVPLSTMRSMLSTSMLPSDATVPVCQMVLSPEVSGGVNKAPSIGKGYIGVAAILLLSISIGVYAMSDEPSIGDIVSRHNVFKEVEFSDEIHPFHLLESDEYTSEFSESILIDPVEVENPIASESEPLEENDSFVSIEKPLFEKLMEEGASDTEILVTKQNSIVLESPNSEAISK